MDIWNHRPCPRCGNAPAIRGDVLDRVALNPRQAGRIQLGSNPHHGVPIARFSACTRCGLIWTYVETDRLGGPTPEQGQRDLCIAADCAKPSASHAKLLPYVGLDFGIRTFRSFRPDGLSFWKWGGLVRVTSGYNLCHSCGIVWSAVSAHVLLATIKSNCTGKTKREFGAEQQTGLISSEGALSAPPNESSV